MENIVIIVLLVIIFGMAVCYIRKEKKKGSGCIGCPSSGCCSCKGCNNVETDTPDK